MRQCRIVVGSILFLVLLAMANYAIADNGVIGVPNSKLTQNSIAAGILNGVNKTGGIGNISGRLTPKPTFVVKGTLIHKADCGDCTAGCQLKTEDWQLCHDACYQKYPKDSTCGLKAEFANCEDCIKYSPSGEPYRSGWIRSCYAQFDSCNLKQLTCDNCLNTCKDYTDPAQQKQCQVDCKKLFPDNPSCNLKACEDCRSGCDAKTWGERLNCYEECSEKIPGVCEYTSCTDCLRNCFPISWETNPNERRACDDACRKKAFDPNNKIFDPCITPSPTSPPKSGFAILVTPRPSPTAPAQESVKSADVSQQDSGRFVVSVTTPIPLPYNPGTSSWAPVAGIGLSSNDRVVSGNPGSSSNGENSYAQGNFNTGGFTTGGVGLSSGDRVVSGKSDSGSTGSSPIAGLANPGGSSSGGISGVFRPNFMSNSTLNKSTTNKTGKNVTMVVRTVNVTLNVTKK